MAGNADLAHPAAMSTRTAASPSERSSAGAAADLLSEINAASPQVASRLVAPFIENAPWLAERAIGRRPFSNVDALLDALASTIQTADIGDQLRLLGGHPELAGAEARAGRMTAESTGEQGRLGLDRLSPGDLARLDTANRAYRARFGFPYIVALHRHGALSDIFRDLDARMGNDPDTERACALNEVIAVTRGRLIRHFGPFPILPTA